jgi:uncharacterized delta-60 repeat protein
MLLGRCVSGTMPINCAVRLHANGDLDTAYGIPANGHVVRQQALGLMGSGNGTGLIHPDGRVSFVVNHPTLGVQIARIGADGRTVTDPPLAFHFEPAVNSPFSTVVAVLAAPGGGVFVVGAGNNLMGRARPAVAKLRADLSFDPDYGVQGRRLFDLESLDPSDDTVRAAALDAEGRLVIAYRRDASTTTPNVLARLRADGDPDFTFGVLARAALTDSANFSFAALAIDGLGRIVYAGSGQSDFIVGRVLADGNEDPGFGTALGRRNVAFDIATGIFGSIDFAYGILIQPDGMLLISGAAQRVVFPERYYLAIARLTTSGQLDSSFAGDGLTLGTFGADVYTNNSDSVNAMTLDAAGNLMIAGTGIDTSDRFQFGIGRIHTGLATEFLFRSSFE